MQRTDFPAAYARFWGPIRAKCQRLLGNTAAADDVSQEAFLRLWQSGPPLEAQPEPRHVLAWLYLTSTRLCLDSLRRGRALGLLAEAPDVSCAAGPPGCL